MYKENKKEKKEGVRNKKEEIVMLDIKDMNKGAFIQRGLLNPLKTSDF